MIKSIAKAYVPRNHFARLLMVLMLLAGAGFPQMLHYFDHGKPGLWLGQYMNAMVLLGLGTSLGNNLGRVHQWPVNSLIPRLANHHFWFCVSVLLMVWAIYTPLTVLTGWDAGAAYTTPMVLAAFSLMTGAGFYKNILAPVVILLLIMFAIETSRSLLMFALSHPFTEWVFIGLTYVFFTVTYKGLKTPYAKRYNEHLVSWVKLIELPLTNLRQEQKELFHKPSIADWKTSLIWLAQWLVLILGLWLLDANPDIALTLALLGCLFASVLPLLYLKGVRQGLDLMWLSGIHTSRAALGRTVFAKMIYLTVRLCLSLGLVGIAANLVFDETFKLELFLTICLVTPAIAAILTVAALSTKHPTSRMGIDVGILMFVMLAATIGMGWFAAWSAAYYDFSAAIGLSAVVSFAITLLCCWLTGLRFQLRSSW